MQRVLILRIWDMLLDFIILLARLGLKIWDCCVIYGVTFPEENLTSLPVMFRASGSCLGTTNRSRWHPQAGLWIWCWLAKLGAFRLGDGGVIWEPVPKKTQHHTNPVYLDAISQGCVPELDHDQSISQGPNGGPCSQRAAPLDSILCCSWETCWNCCLLSSV